MFLNLTLTSRRLLPAVAINASGIWIYPRNKRSAHFRNRDTTRFSFRNKRSGHGTPNEVKDTRRTPNTNKEIPLQGPHAHETSHPDLRFTILTSVICVLAGIIICFILFFAIKKYIFYRRHRDLKRHQQMCHNSADSSQTDYYSFPRTYDEPFEIDRNGARSMTTICSTWSTDSRRRTTDSELSTVHISFSENSFPRQHLRRGEYITPCTPPLSVSTRTSEPFDESIFSSTDSMTDWDGDSYYTYDSSDFHACNAGNYRRISGPNINSYSPECHCYDHRTIGSHAFSHNSNRTQFRVNERINRARGNYVNVNINLRDQTNARLRYEQTDIPEPDPWARHNMADTSHLHCPCSRHSAAHDNGPAHLSMSRWSRRTTLTLLPASRDGSADQY